MSIARALVSSGLTLIAIGCGTPDPTMPPREPGPHSTGTMGTTVSVPMSCPVKPPDPGRPRVMVIDDGFDVRHPAFAGKIAGCYQIECPDETPFSARVGESEDDTAARLVEHLRTLPPECALREGFTLNVDAYLERFDPAARDEWNAGMLQKGNFESYTDEQLGTMLEATRAAAYHGTATAGAIVYENDVDIVLVQIKLGTVEDVQKRLSCLDQADIDLDTRLLSRPEVADAYAASPPSGRERRVLELRRDHGIRVENRSFGPISTGLYESLLRSKGCPRVELDDNMQVNAQLDARRDAVLRANGAFDGTDVLVFQAGGNDGQQIDDGGDNVACTPERVDRLFVGAYDIYRGHPTQAFFSNFGECIDLYAYGQSVILPTAAGLYGTFTGTSFAAPLAARYASKLAVDFPTTTALRDRIFAARDVHRFLPIATMPAELSYFSRATIGSRTTPSLSPSLVDPGKRAPLLH
jgi:Subtilase family